MRLQLAAAPPVPVNVGNPASSAGSSWGASRLVMDRLAPASATGVLTSVSIYVATGGNLYVMTGSVSGSNYTVRAISSLLSAPTGLTAYTYPVSLPIVAGDCIAYYSPSAGGAVGKYQPGIAGGVSFNASAPVSTPTAGTVLAFSTTDGTLALGGTG